MKDKITQIHNDYFSNYRKTTQYPFEGNVKNEFKRREQYKGRELFELLQNIDDAWAKCEKKEGECVASIRLDGNVLIISNNGAPFTVESLQRLCQGEVSEKTKEYIGNKGIGFRSVLNWTDDIEIYSGDLADPDNYISVKFSREHADHNLQRLLNDISEEVRRHIEDQIESLEKKGIKALYPLLNSPVWIEPKKKEFVTEIRLSIRDEEVRENILRDIRDFDENVIIFLPYISRILFNVTGDDDFHREIKKEFENEGKIVRIESGEKMRRFYFASATQKLPFKYEESDIIKLGVAIPIEYKEGMNYPLYTFFPLKDIESPFEALLNATFCVTDNRNAFEMDTDLKKLTNRTVMQRLIEFYAETVVKTIERDDRLKFLTPARGKIKSNLTFDSALFHFNDPIVFRGDTEKLYSHENYVRLLRDYEVFYSIEGKYLKPSDEKLIILQEASKFFQGKEFEDLVHLSGREYTFGMMLQTNSKYEESLLLEAINSATERWEPSERAEVFKWWNDRRYLSLPRLLRKRNPKDGEDEFITDQKIPVFLSGSITKIPEWAKITLLNKDDEENLLNQYLEQIGDSDKKKRDLQTLIKANKEIINIREQSSRADLISPVNDSVPSDGYNEAMEFLEWLFDVWKDDHGQFKEKVKSIDYNLPTTEKKVRNTKTSQIYVGDPEINKVGSRIFGLLHKYKAVDISGLRLKESGKDIGSFLSDIGVRRLPEIKLVQTPRLRLNEIKNVEILDYIKSYHSKNFSETGAYELKMHVLEDLSKILSILPTPLVLQWLQADNRLKNLVESKFEPDGTWAGYYPDKQRKAYTYLRNDEKTLSFIRYLFMNTPWIDLPEGRKKPVEVLLPRKNYEGFDTLGISYIPDALLNEWATAIGESQYYVRQLLLKTGVMERFTDMEAPMFYTLLLKISGLENEEAIRNSYKVSKAIYKDIIDAGLEERGNNFYRDCIEKKDFKERFGKVLAKDYTGNKSYRPVREVKFSSSAMLQPKGTWLIDVPPRSGKKEMFKEILGVEEPEKDLLALSYNISETDKAFQHDFKDFLAYFLCYYTGSLQSLLWSLNVRLVKELTIGGNEEIMPELYSPVKDTNSHWVIFAGDKKDYKDLDRGKLALAITQIIYVVLNFPSKDIQKEVELLFNYDRQHRKEWAQRELDNPDEVASNRNKLRNSAEIREQIRKRLIEKGFDQKALEINQRIDWGNQDNATIQALMVELLKLTGIDPEELQEITGTPLSFREYNLDRIARIVRDNTLKVENLIYSYLLENKAQRPKLRHLWAEFTPENYKGKFTPREIDSNPFLKVESIVEDFLNEKGIPETDSIETLDFERIYEENLHKIKEEFGAGILNDFTSHWRLYFPDEMQNVKEELDRIKNETEVIEEEGTDEDPDIEEVYKRSSLTNELKCSKPSVSTNPGGGGKVSQKRKHREERENATQGEMAERLVLKYLGEKKLKEAVDFLGERYEVKWVSGNALNSVKENSAKWRRDKNAADNLGYDIKVVSADGTKAMYIEVKSSSGRECRFVMSDNEYAKMVALNGHDHSRYRIVFVSDLNLKDPNSSPLVTLIDEDVTDENIFLRVSNEYTFHYKGVNILSETSGADFGLLEEFSSQNHSDKDRSQIPDQESD